jgi:hypothetical protein
VLTLVAVAVAVAFAEGGGSSQASTAVPATLPGQLTGAAPWPANTTMLRARLSALHLPALGQEGTRLHLHQHLDLFVSGARVTVPAGIGIDPAERFISPLHTHDTSGVIHVESPTVRNFTLGEFFGVWGVRFRNGCLGGYCSGHGRGLRVFVDGRRVSGGPGRVVLAAHQEIVVAFGTARQLPRPIPARYAFGPGL